MKTIKKIKFTNALGISEITLEPGQINIISGKKGTGKTSILDAINTTLSNKNVRSEFIKKGETEATMYIELSDGVVIDRTKSLVNADKIKIRGDESTSTPESYLRALFNDKQFRPISFVEADTKDQNKILLSLLNIEWNSDDIQKWFGEVPETIDYNDHILNVLDRLQAKNGAWYVTREDINRDIRNKRAIIKDMLDNIPDKYNAEKWRSVKLSDLYAEVSKAHEHNKSITENQLLISEADNKCLEIDAKRIEDEGLEDSKLLDFELTQKQNIESLNKRIAMLQQEIVNCNNAIKIKQTQSLTAKTNIINLAEAEKKSVREKAAMLKGIKTSDPIPVEPLEEEANMAEKMKSYLNEYDSAMSMNKEISSMEAESNRLTELIDIARTMPGELLKTADCPIEGLSVVEGVPLIKGLPIQNLSTGEQLELAVDIAKALSGELGVILVDRFESLDTDSQNVFLEKCKQSGLQYFITKVSNDDYEVKTY